MDNEIPFLAVGNEELHDFVSAGDTVELMIDSKPVQCTVDCSTNPKTGEKTNTLMFVTHNGTSYLVGIMGKLLSGITVIRRANG